MNRLVVLDLFAGEGGAAVGYRWAGWDVRCVDINAARLRHNPCPSRPADAFDVLEHLLRGGRVGFYRFGGGGRPDFNDELSLADIAAIHASPPCQGYTRALLGHPEIAAKWPRLIDATRALLQETGKPYVIENVEQARSQMVDPIMLCGRTFGLHTTDEDGFGLVLDRHRLFESNVELSGLPQSHRHRTGVLEQVAGVYGGSRRAKRLPGESLADVAPRDRHAARHERHGGYVPRSKRVQQELLGIDWMTVRGMQESIPPAYTEFIGRQLLEQQRT